MNTHAPSTTAGSKEHLVQFYADQAELAAHAGAYLTEALETGGVAVVIATQAHHRLFQDQFREAGIEVAQAIADGRLVVRDAGATLALLMPEGSIDQSRFASVVGDPMRDTVDSGGPVRAFGEMVALLWDRGDVVSMIELERLWNELQAELAFSLFCAYDRVSFRVPDDQAMVDHVCHLHSAIVPADSGKTELAFRFTPSPDAPREARRLVDEALAGSGHDERLRCAARLVLSELTTNAVVHARSPFSVVARMEQRVVRLSVYDQSHLRPAVRHPASGVPTGRGLHVVAALSSRWGVEPTPAGKIVWAELRA